jgi:hypothetical protein
MTSVAERLLAKGQKPRTKVTVTFSGAGIRNQRPRRRRGHERVSQLSGGERSAVASKAVIAAGQPERRTPIVPASPGLQQHLDATNIHDRKD